DGFRVWLRHDVRIHSRFLLRLPGGLRAEFGGFFRDVCAQRGRAAEREFFEHPPGGPHRRAAAAARGGELDRTRGGGGAAVRPVPSQGRRRRDVRPCSVGFRRHLRGGAEHV